MQRTMLLIKDDRLAYPVIVDLFRLTSDKIHTYDYPIHHRGQLITMNFEYQAHDETQQPLGEDFGYQHIWNEAAAKLDESPKITWLDGNRYYSLVTSAWPNTEVFFGRTGANDPNFNLISEPMFIIQRQAKDHLFATVIEPHGYFNEAREQTENARGEILEVTVIGHNDAGSVIEVVGKNDLHWRIIVNNGKASETAKHSVDFGGKKYSWVGNFEVELDVK